MSHARFARLREYPGPWPQGPPSQSKHSAFPNTFMAPHISSILQHTLPLPPSPAPFAPSHYDGAQTLNVQLGVDANGNSWLALGTERQKSWENKIHYPNSSLSFPSLDNKMQPLPPSALPSNSTANLSNGTDRTATGSHGVSQPLVWRRERRSKTKREPKQRCFAKETSNMIWFAE